MNTSEIPVTPIKQTMVNIAGNDVLGVLLEGGQVAASLRMMCDLLGVDYMGQMRKIRANRAIYDSLILAKVETAGGAQETNVIIAEAIPIWLAHIYENKVSPEARETLIEFQRVAVQTLRAFFFPEIREQPKQSAPPKPEPEHIAPPKEEPAAQPFPPPPPRSPDVDEFAYWEWVVAGFTGLEGHIREMAALLKQTRAEPMQTAQQLEQHTQALKEHFATLLQHKEMLEQQAGILHQHAEQLRALTLQVERLKAPSPLTAEHLGELHVRLLALEHQTGQPASTLERELASTFGGETISQLSEAAWGEITAWFQQRLGW